ncbi:hypothetical protein [Streptomyces sp. NPDC088246]|uniref:hypothetical protein n=1 Tax=Streptomyces sp. NPDC088246 TaxID=3365842 RepID=UPI0037F4BB19
MKHALDRAFGVGELFRDDFGVVSFGDEAAHVNLAGGQTAEVQSLWAEHVLLQRADL